MSSAAARVVTVNGCSAAASKEASVLFHAALKAAMVAYFSLSSAISRAFDGHCDARSVGTTLGTSSSSGSLLMK